MLNGYFAWTSSNCRKHPTIKISLEKIYYILLYRYNSDELFSTERTPTLLFLIISRQEKYKDFKYRIQLNGENGARLPPFHIYISKSNISPLFFALEYLLKKKNIYVTHHFNFPDAPLFNQPDETKASLASFHRFHLASTTHYLKPVKRRSIFHRDWPLSLFLSLSLKANTHTHTHTHTHRILGHFVVIIEVPSGSSSLALTFYCHAHVWPIPHPCVIDGTLSWKGRCLLLNERGHRPMEIVNERVILSLCYTSAKIPRKLWEERNWMKIFQWKIYDIQFVFVTFIIYLTYPVVSA